MLSLIPMFSLFILSVTGGSLFVNRMVPVLLVRFSFCLKMSLLLAVVGVLLGVTILLLQALELKFTRGSQTGWVGFVIMWFLGDFFSFTRGVLS